MDLSTRYLGLNLKNPIIVSSSDLTASVENVSKCEQAGAAAVVLKSLFEEQILADIEKNSDMEVPMFQWHPEAFDYVREHTRAHAVDEYLTLIEKSKQHVSIPVIPSINCVSPHEWPAFASKLQDAGADAIELNIAIFPFDEEVSGESIEFQYMKIVEEVKKHVTIPVAVKIGPYFSNLSQIAHKLDGAGTNGLVLFNRFYRPDIDIQNLKIFAGELLSAPNEMAHSLRWIGLLANKISCDLAASTGIHDGAGVIKQLLVGADATMVCSKLYKKGFSYIGSMLQEIETWMKTQQFKDVAAFKGLLSPDKANTAAWERIQFMKKNNEGLTDPMSIESYKTHGQ